MKNTQGAQEVCADVLQATESSKLESEEFPPTYNACSGLPMAPAGPS